MLTAVESLDQLLAESDADSMDWNDGLGYEGASELLAKFREADWAELEARCQSRHSKWRECLATVLRPQYGQQAQQLLFSLASDTEGEVAFYTLLGIAFYCGVNANAEGAYLDRRIRVPSFVAAANKAPDLLAAVERVNMQSSEPFKRRFQLLAEVIRP